MFVEAGAGLPTGMDYRGSCPDSASISDNGERKICEIFFPTREDKRM